MTLTDTQKKLLQKLVKKISMAGTTYQFREIPMKLAFNMAIF